MTHYNSKSVTQRSSFSNVKHASTGTQVKLTRGAMVTDICLVAVWGATIPALMWLGVAGGF